MSVDAALIGWFALCWLLTGINCRHLLLVRSCLLSHTRPALPERLTADGSPGPAPAAKSTVDPCAEAMAADCAAAELLLVQCAARTLKNLLRQQLRRCADPTAAPPLLVGRHS